MVVLILVLIFSFDICINAYVCFPTRFSPFPLFCALWTFSIQGLFLVIDVWCSCCRYTVASNFLPWLLVIVVGFNPCTAFVPNLFGYLSSEAGQRYWIWMPLSFSAFYYIGHAMVYTPKVTTDFPLRLYAMLVMSSLHVVLQQLLLAGGLNGLSWKT